VHDGVVTLSGNVPNRFHRRELVELVRRVEGVIDVVDRLYDDYEVRRSVALRRSVPSARIRASSLLGRVALVGRTESQSEMERAIAVTQSLPGVRAVVNRIEVEALRPAV
jgi:osmotically-inducible protein OsmY